MFGFRLRPGATIDRSRLLKHASELNNDLSLIATRIRETCFVTANLGEALAALASASTVNEAAAHSGVELRTFQRLIRLKTGFVPKFWIQLARVRRAARDVATAKSLADVAIESRFSDQAHMTRQFKRWFGVTPVQFAVNPDLRSLIHELGYD